MSKFETIIGMSPYSWEEIVAMGVNYLADELESSKVKFTVVDNGVRIGIVCDEENQVEAAKFWKEYVDPHLKGEK